MNKIELVIENESMVLGCILKDPSLLDESRLSPSHFINIQNRELFKAMHEIKKDGQEIDIISIAQLGESRNMKFGGTSYLSNLINSIPSIHGFKQFEQNILNFHTINKAQEYVNEFLNNTTETYQPKHLSQLIQQVTELESNMVKKNTSFKEKIMNRMDHHYNSPKNGLSGVNTGFLGLNRFTDGWQYGDLIIVAARPSVGKTALVLNSMIEGCKKDPNMFVTFFSIEMAEGQIIDRFIAKEGKINLMKMRNPNKTFSKDEWMKYSEAVGKIENMNIDIRGDNAVPDIRSAIRKNMREHAEKNHLVALDFLTLIKHHDPTGNKHQEVSDIIRDLKGIAKDLNVPFIVITQLNRSLESRKEKTPQMSDLGESGTIEQVADVIMLLYREDYYNDTDTKIVEINIAKNRQGSTGRVDLKFYKETNTFHDVT